MIDKNAVLSKLHRWIVNLQRGHRQDGPLKFIMAHVRKKYELNAVVFYCAVFKSLCQILSMMKLKKKGS